MNSTSTMRRVLYRTVCVAAVAAAMAHARPAMAYTFNAPSGWEVTLDTNVAYSLGVRADKMDGKIGNFYLQQNNEYKFPNMGNITTNRFDLASELAVTYQDNDGFDVSIAAWKDFAYNGGTQNNPGNYAPGVPFSALSSSPTGHYGAYTNNFYNVGAELENAFAFSNFQIGPVPVELKVGRFTEYWGNALFSGAQAISYSQSPIDIIKAVDAPGTEVKDLFMPRGQVTLHAQVTPDLTLGFQYAFEYRYSRLPEGGTFLGILDPLYIGPQSLGGAYARQRDVDPPNVDGNFGVEAIWAPDFLNGQIGLYFRQFDDVTPYAPFQLNVTGAAPTYHLAYARHALLYGVSLDKEIGTISTGIESSIRENTALYSVPGGDPATDPTGNDGARGNTFNVVANALYGLTPSPLWQTGTAVAEIAWTRVLAVTHDKAVYNAEGYACAGGGLNGGNGERDGCATQDEVNVNVVFDPQWLQVRPGIDVDAPVSIDYGLHGNGQTLALAGTGDDAGSISYSAGVHAFVRQKYNVTLKYTGFHSPTGKIGHTPSGLAYYATGSGQYMWNDKAQILLTVSMAF